MDLILKWAFPLELSIRWLLTLVLDGLAFSLRRGLFTRSMPLMCVEFTINSRVYM